MLKLIPAETLQNHQNSADKDTHFRPNLQVKSIGKAKYYMWLNTFEPAKDRRFGADMKRKLSSGVAGHHGS